VQTFLQLFANTADQKAKHLEDVIVACAGSGRGRGSSDVVERGGEEGKTEFENMVLLDDLIGDLKGKLFHRRALIRNL
jgi:hypothetical protein